MRRYTEKVSYTDDPVYASDDSVDSTAEVINADTLGGKLPSEFALAGYGYGDELIYLGSSTIDDAEFTANLTLLCNSLNETTKQVYFHLWGFPYVGTLWSGDEGYAVLTGVGYVGIDGNNYKPTRTTRICVDGVWGDWVDESTLASADKWETFSGDESFLEWINSKFDEMPNSSTRQVSFHVSPIGGVSGHSQTWWGVLYKYGDGKQGHIKAISYRSCSAVGRSDLTEISRNKVNGTWDDWEWVNPPMLAGQEYRTTERYLGKPVYTKIINHGALAVANTTVTISTGISVVTALVEYEIMLTLGSGNIIKFPQHGLYEANHMLTGYFAPANRAFVLQTHGDYSNATAMVTLKYTKD